MFETLATIGLASNIVQFVDFGVRLVSKGQELYQSRDGVLKENVELEEITTDLKSLSQNIANSAHSNASGQPASKSEKSLRKLAGTCTELAEELLGILQGLKVDSRRNRKWESIKKSLLSVWKRGQVREIEKRLEKIKEEVCLHLIVLLGNRQSILLPAIDDLTNTTKTIGTETRDKLDTIRMDLQNLIRTEPWTNRNMDGFNRLSHMLMTLTEEGEKAKKVYAILKSLHFKQMKVRQSDVKDAHRKTFEWIFQGKRNLKFVDWLRSEDGVYWVAGKAGSGKSTLMKFLCKHHRSKQFLQEWAGPQKIIIATHFFWSAGTPMQKSQEGLLRSLLFQVLSQCPELIPVICPDRWSDNLYPSFRISEAWTRSELFRAFETLAGLGQLSMRFCFFIDGLDEYDGEHSDIINIIQITAASPSIKHCVSSRPWTVFVDAFGGSDRKLYLQELTQDDIRLYVKDSLEEDPRFQKFRRRHASSAYLVQQVVDKAQGVFLWVFLVVRSLLRGLTSEDDISDLNRRLEELPRDLETYFKHMLDTIEDVYQQQTARIFQIMVHAETILNVLTFHFLDDEEDDPHYPLYQEVRPLLEDEIVQIVERKRRQLNARCKDLLEINEHTREHTFFRYSVDFLHRTVMDFLRTNDMHKQLSIRAGPGFDPRVSMCKASLAQIKAIPTGQDSEPLEPGTSDLVYKMLYYVREVEIHNGVAEIELLDDMDRALSTLHSRSSPLHWVNVIDLGHRRSRTWSNISFLEFAVGCRLRLYVAQKLSESPKVLHESRGFPLLRYALQSDVLEARHPFRPDIFDTIDLEMLRLLLDRGADPNQATNSDQRKTVWGDFLHQCYVSIIPETNKDSTRALDNSSIDLTGTNHRSVEPTRHSAGPTRFAEAVENQILLNWYEACEMVILHGGHADTYPTKAVEVFRAIFSESQAQRLETLLRNKQPIVEHSMVPLKHSAKFTMWKFLKANFWK